MFGFNKMVLDNDFPQKWINRRGREPARSPDLSPLDYLFWDKSPLYYPKEKVFKTNPQHLEELRVRSVREAGGVPFVDVSKLKANHSSIYYNCVCTVLK